MIASWEPSWEIGCCLLSQKKFWVVGIEGSQVADGLLLDVGEQV